jgi:aminopeptidase N
MSIVDRIRISIVLAICLSFGTFVHTRGDEPRRSAGDRPADITHIALNLGVDVPEKTVKGSATIDLVALREIKSIRFDAVDFDVADVTIARGEGSPVPVRFVNDGESIEVLLGDTPLAQSAPATIIIHYTIKNPKNGLHFFAPTEEEPDTPFVVWSQGESITNRYWVPCFDHPNEMQTTEMIVTAAKGNEVISNGKLLSKKENANDTVTFHWLQDKPHVSYLMTLIVGEFHVESETWRGKPVTYYVPQKHRDDVKRSFGNTARMLEYFTKLTGVEYPWDKYAQVCTEQFGGGMENTSATTLGDNTLHDARAHLDTSSDSLVAHELAHQWFGDLVTCKDWAHLWLNEGFASFMSPIWFEFDLGTEEYDYSIFNAMNRGFTGGKKRPVVDRHWENPRDMFDGRAYPKGASILHMLRRRVGTDMFWQSVNRYLNDNRHHPVETHDLRKAFERVTGRSLERFFYDWTERPGAPSLEVAFSWNEENKLGDFSVKQTQEAEAFHIPFEVEFHFEEGRPITFRREMTDKETRFYYPLPAHPTMVLVDPRDAVLKEIKEKKGRDLWAAQLTSAPYVVQRIRAAKHFGDEGGGQDVELLTEALSNESFWGVGAEIAKALGEAGGDGARDALLACMHHQHPKVRRPCVSELGSFADDDTVVSALQDLIEKGDPSYRVEAAAINAYGKVKTEGAVAFLVSLLDRDSHREQIRSAALRAMGEQSNTEGLLTLLDWTKPGKPRWCRIASFSSLGSLAENVKLTEEESTLVVDALTEGLDSENRWIQGTAIRGIKQLGEDAKPALPKLRTLAAHSPERRIQNAAKEAVEKITSAAPAEVQVDDLRAELKSLQASNGELADRIQKLESMLDVKVAGDNR